MDGYLNFRSSALFKYMQPTKLTDLYQSAKCASVYSIVFPGSSNLFLVILMYSSIAIFVFLRNFFCAKINNLRLIVGAVWAISMLSILLCVFATSMYALVLNIIVKDFSLYNVFHSLIKRFGEIQREGHALFGIINDLDLLRNIDKYKQVVETAKSFALSLREFTRPLLESDIIPFLMEEFVLFNGTLNATELNATFAALLERSLEMASFAEEKIAFVEENYQGVMRSVVSVFHMAGQAANLASDWLRLSENTVVLVAVNLISLQYGATILLCVFMVVRTRNILRHRKKLRPIWIIHILIFGLIICGKKMIFNAVENVCFAIDDFEADVGPLRYLQGRGNYFKDKEGCFLHWKNTGLREIDQSSLVSEAIVTNCVFEANSSFLDAAYEQTKIDQKQIFEYFEIFFKVLSRGRRVIHYWENAMETAEDSTRHNPVIGHIYKIVEDVNRVYEGFTDTYGGQAVLTKKVNDLNSCVFLHEAFANARVQICSVLSNVLFASLIADFVLLLAIMLNPAT